MNTPSIFEKNIVLTGATNSIGRLTALQLAHEGANLILAGTDELELEDLALECERFKIKAYPYKMDASKIDDLSNTFEFALEELGSVDIWINNASVKAEGEFSRIPIETHEQVIRSNLMSVIYSSYVLLPYFKERRSGTIINNISLGKFVPKGYSSAIREEIRSLKEIHICDIFPSYLNGIPRMIYSPEVIASVITDLCYHPKDKVVLGHAPAMSHLMSKLMAQFVHTYLKGAEALKVSEQNKESWRGFKPLRRLIKS